MRKPDVMMKIVLLATSILASSLAAARPALAGPARPNDEEDRRYAARGVNMMMDGDLDGAVEVFQQIEQKDPDSPLGFVLEADATWWKIYYVSANLIDPDVFDVANMEATPYDSHFDDLDNVAIRKAEARIHLHQDLARSYLYEGFAYALRARLEGLHDRDLATARAGKKMRAHLLRALELDPSLTDAYLGVGIYNYFVDTLPGIVKFLSVFIGLPGGSRTEGLRQLQTLRGEGRIGEGGSEVLSRQGLLTRSTKNSTRNPCASSGSCNRNFPTTPSGRCSSAACITAWEDPKKARKSTARSIKEPRGKIPKWTKPSTTPPAKPWNGNTRSRNFREVSGHWSIGSSDHLNCPLSVVRCRCRRIGEIESAAWSRFRLLPLATDN